MTDQTLINNEDDGEVTDLSVVDKTVILAPSQTNQHSDALLKSKVELSDMNINLLKTTDQAKKIVSLKEMDDELTNAGVLDKNSAALIANVVPEISGKISLATYTEMPTRTNVRETKLQLKQAISKEQAVLIDLCSVYIKKPYEASLNMLEELKMSHLPGLARINESLKSEIDTWLAGLLEAKDENVAKLFDSDLQFLEIGATETSSRDLSNLITSITSIKVLLNVTDVKSFMSTFQYLDFDKAITIKQLAQFLADPAIGAKLGEMLTKVICISASVKEAVEKVVAVADKPDALSMAIIERTGILSAYTGRLLSLTNLVHNLVLLNLSIKQLIISYSKM